MTATRRNVLPRPDCWRPHFRIIAGEPFRQGLVLGYAGFDETVIDTSITTLAQALR